jgi:phage terminase large subunit-like protein
MLYGLDRDNKRIWTGREYETIDAPLEDDEEWRNVWQDKEIWEKVNPSIGHTVSWEKAEDQFTRSQGNLVRERNFRWLRLNSWEKLKTSKWIGLDFWDRCKGKIDIERLKGRPCYGGLDLSSKIDLTAFVLLFPSDDINNKWIVLPWFWVPEDAVYSRVATDKVPYDIWAKQGYLQTTPGNVIDYSSIEKTIVDVSAIYDIQQIGFDPWNAIQTAINLGDEGLTMVEVRPTYGNMSPAMGEIKTAVMSKRLLHGRHPILRWNAGNVEVRMDENENIRPDKSKSTERIDGMVALINAMSRAILQEDTTSIYGSRGVLTF